MMACEICQEIAGLPVADYVRRTGTATPRALDLGHGVAVMPSLGPLSDFHVLVMPIEHVCSSAAARDDIRDVVWSVAEHLREAAAAMHSSTVIFEHGQTQEGAGCGVSHAHVHVLALPKTEPLELPSGIWRNYTDAAGHRVAEASREYLLISRRSSSWAIRYETGIQSQYLRRWLAAYLGDSEWDWRQPTRRDQSLQEQTRMVASLLAPRYVGAA